MTEDTNISGAPSTKMEQTLAERGSRYGSWRTQAEIAQAIKDAYRSAPNWALMPAYMRETLDINANKMARALNGDFMYLDNWHDATNYHRLAEDCLEQDIANGVEGLVISDPLHLPWETRLDNALQTLHDLGFTKLATWHERPGVPPSVMSAVNEHGESPWKVAADHHPKGQEDVRAPAFMRDGVRGALAGRNNDAP